MRGLEYFPYQPRLYQEQVIHDLARYVRYRNVCLHAPTGFGKTPVILAALLPYVEQGYRIIWAVRTGNETDRPIEELKVIAEKLGVSVFGVSLRGKRDMCLLAREYGETLDHGEVSYMCRQMKSKCPYYRRYRRSFDPQPFIYRGPLTYTDVFEVATSMGVCPYYAQHALLQYADVISLSYNYVVDPRLEWSIKRSVRFREAILVVDEAHNLQRIELGSDAITLGTMKRAAGEARSRGAEDVEELVKRIEETCLEKFGGLRDEEDAEYRPGDFVGEEDRDLLETGLRIGELIRREMLEEGKRPRSSLYHFCSFWLAAMELEGTRGIAFIAERDGDNIRLNIWDMRSAEVLSERWGMFYRCVFCSGTLEPIDAFAEVIGLRRYASIRVPNVFRRENVRVYLVKDLTTRGEELGEEMASAYVSAVKAFLENVGVNTAVFTASYRVQAELVSAGLLDRVREAGYQVFEERRNMSGQDARKMLEEFKRSPRALLVAPMGGRFAEGADFPGEELQAVFLVGIPFDKPTTRTRLYLEYYRELYGDERGRLYGYVIPAIRRAAQALGRALRSPSDRAVLVLGDGRYERYMPLLPDYVRKWYRPVLSDELGSVEKPW